MSEQATPKEKVLPELNIKGTIIKTSPSVVEDYILDKLAVQLIEDIESKELPVTLEEITKTVTKFIDTVMRPYLSTRLGGQILDPRFGVSVIRDRLLQFSDFVMKLQVEYTDKILNELENEVLSSSEVKIRIQRLLYLIDISFIMVREIANRLFTLFQLNAPFPARPPLANALLGAELIGGEEA